MIALAIILALAANGLLLAAGLNETRRKVGGISFYRIGRYRFTICKAKGDKA